MYVTHAVIPYKFKRFENSIYSKSIIIESIIWYN